MGGIIAAHFLSWGGVAAALSPTSFAYPTPPSTGDRSAVAYLDQSSVEPTAARETPRLLPASYFMNGDRNDPLLEAIRERTDNEIGFNHHYSMVFVPCGTGCGSFWFVDRRTGGVVEAPVSAAEGEAAWDISASSDSDQIQIIYGPLYGTPGNCSAQAFRWSGNAFVALAGRVPARCPG